MDKSITHYQKAQSERRRTELPCRLIAVILDYLMWKICVMVNRHFMLAVIVYHLKRSRKETVKPVADGSACRAEY